MSAHSRKVVQYRRPVRLNIGVVVFIFIFIYLVIIVFSFFNQKHISIYEVTEKNIADDNTCQGVIIRDEKVVTATKAGYVNYYAGDGTRVAKTAAICTIDESGKIYDLLTGTESVNKITADERGKIRSDIAGFRKEFNGSNYNIVKNFKYDIDNAVLEMSQISEISSLEKLMKDNNVTGSYHIEKSTASGLVTYFVDGLENLTPDTVSADTFNMENYKRTQLRSSTGAITAGTPIYKLITSEKWSVVLSLSEEQYKKLYDKEQEQLKQYLEQHSDESGFSGKINVNFVKDNLKTTVSFSVFQKDSGYYAKLNMDKYMNHYLDDRFVEIELSINSASGLKIPRSAIVEAEFYVIPNEFITQGGKAGNSGIVKEVYKNNGDVGYQFMEEVIYHSDDKNTYIEIAGLEVNDWIRNPETQNRYQIGKKEKLMGVYNVNKGYCVFRRIEKVYENEEYCIIRPDTDSGLSAYDHIVVDAATVNQQELLK